MTRVIFSRGPRALSSLLIRFAGFGSRFWLPAHFTCSGISTCPEVHLTPIVVVVGIIVTFFTPWPDPGFASFRIQSRRRLIFCPTKTSSYFSFRSSRSGLIIISGSHALLTRQLLPRSDTSKSIPHTRDHQSTLKHLCFPRGYLFRRYFLSDAQ